MKPSVRLEVDGAAPGGALSSRLISLNVTDAAGWSADALEAKFDDRPPRISPPETGARLRPFFGFEDAPLTPLGVFTVDALSAKADPAALSIHASAADMTTGLKEPRTRAWENVALGDVIASIAGAHGLTPAVASSFASRRFDHLSQTGESDLHFLTRLALDMGAISKPGGGFLIFAPRGEGRAATGAPLARLTLARDRIADWRWRSEGRSGYKSVAASWLDHGGGEVRQVQAGGGAPVLTLRRPFANRDAALAAAHAKLRDLNRKSGVLEVWLTAGDPRLSAEARVIFKGLSPAVDGEWSLSKVIHRYELDSGYVTEFEAERPNAD